MNKLEKKLNDSVYVGVLYNQKYFLNCVSKYNYIGYAVSSISRYVYYGRNKLYIKNEKHLYRQLKQAIIGMMIYLKFSKNDLWQLHLLTIGGDVYKNGVEGFSIKNYNKKFINLSKKETIELFKKNGNISFW
jgi:hypothetical protein